MSDFKFATVKDACDVHCHAGVPSCDTRPFTDIFVAQQAAAAGMEALVFKSHYENTVARAFYVNQVVPEIKLFGGIALNRYVGGLNPAAVEATLVAGGKEVWIIRKEATGVTYRQGGYNYRWRRRYWKRYSP